MRANVLRTMPLGVAHAIRAGVALLALLGWVVYHQTLDGGAIIGSTLIVSGVLVLTLYSGAPTH